jgi:hypothetical protein
LKRQEAYSAYLNSGDIMAVIAFAAMFIYTNEDS